MFVPSDRRKEEGKIRDSGGRSCIEARVDVPRVGVVLRKLSLAQRHDTRVLIKDDESRRAANLMSPRMRIVLVTYREVEDLRRATVQAANELALPEGRHGSGLCGGT